MQEGGGDFYLCDSIDINFGKVFPKLTRTFGMPIFAFRFAGLGQAVMLTSPLCSLSSKEKTEDNCYDKHLL